MRRSPDSANKIFYEFNAVGYAIHCWQIAALCILLDHGCTLSAEDEGHILRITDNEQLFLNQLKSRSRD